MLLNLAFYVNVAFLVITSLFMRITNTPILFILSAILLIGVFQATSKKTFMVLLRVLVVCTFHYLSLSNWCIVLYFLLIWRDIDFLSTKMRMILAFFIYSFSYEVLSFLVVHDNVQHANSTFQLIYNIIFFGTTIILLHVVLQSTTLTQRLHLEKNQLITQDPLTGLFNYEEYHRKLDCLLSAQASNTLLILIDCTDLKSMNTSQGFQAGNLILQQAADILKELFHDARIIARYGGDEFAITLHYEDEEQTIQKVQQNLNIDLPNRIGMNVTYGFAMSPKNGKTKDELISVAESNLFNMKRDIWLKREENMLRSEKLKVVGELASGMAHEIRNPLTTIKGFLQISQANNYNIEKWFPLIMAEITRMNTLTAEFLQFSKPHATQLQLLSLQDCIHRVVSLTESEIVRLGYQMNFILPEEPLQIMMDSDKILQLLLNLVKNCYEALRADGFILIRLYESQQMAVIEVADNGKGISSDALEKIFHPFYTSKPNGTGLGLSICHKIVQEHDGVIEVESVQEKGTKFTIRFPLVSTEIFPIQNII
ncbi:ATP-binding protein [Paenibacillus sp. KN14-4R]|uniref:sensor histidine kinase n=1 Tax=Paenibacillus sp. KN14-4R TaxID=3445773 RepID=UPI003FA0BB31